MNLKAQWLRVYVTELGPIDQHEPGADVTGMYRGDLLERLVSEGFLRAEFEDIVPADALAEGDDAVADDGSEDGE